jgi:hypothetical protein
MLIFVNFGGVYKAASQMKRRATLHKSKAKENVAIDLRNAAITGAMGTLLVCIAVQFYSNIQSMRCGIRCPIPAIYG